MISKQEYLKIVSISVILGCTLTFITTMLNNTYTDMKTVKEIETEATEQLSTEPVYLPRTLRGTTDDYGYIIHLDDGTYLTMDDAPEFPDGTRVIINWDINGNVINITELKVN